MDLTKIFDGYNFFARILPSILLISPILIGFWVLWPELYMKGTPSPFVFSAVTLSFLYLLSFICRSKGKRLQKELATEWGGLPTTVMLRHSDKRISAVTKNRYHSFLGEHVPCLKKLPTEGKEKVEPDYADKLYASAIFWLKEQTRDKKLYPIVHQELAEYGFRRNLVGIKNLAIAIYLFFLVFSVVVAIDMTGEHFGKTKFLFGFWEAVSSSPNVWVIVLISLIALISAFLMNKEWVKEAAENYAHSLLLTCDAPKI